MANEIQFGYRTGATLTYGVYQPDGTVRTAAATELPEIAGTGYYTTDDEDVVVGDMIVVLEGTTVVGQGLLELKTGLATEAKQDIIDTVVDRIAAIQESDKTLDVAAGTLTYQTKGTTTAILQKSLKDPDGAAVDSTEDIIATEVNVEL